MIQTAVVVTLYVCRVTKERRKIKINPQQRVEIKTRWLKSANETLKSWGNKSFRGRNLNKNWVDIL